MDDDPLTMEELRSPRLIGTLLWCGFWGWMALIGLVTTCRWVWEHVFS